MNYNKGDLVVFHDRYGSRKAGVITYEGSRVSLYVEDRPYRIIDTKSYRVICSSGSEFIYDYQIEEILNNKEKRDV